MLRGILIGLLVIAAGTTGVQASTVPQSTPDQNPGEHLGQRTSVNDTASDVNGTVINQTNPNYRLNSTGNHTYTIKIGNGSGQMLVILNLSLFGNLPNPGALRFRSYGFVKKTQVIAVEIGIGFTGIGDLWSFFANPFSRFGVEAQTTLRLPFLNTEAATNTNGMK